MKVYAPDLNLYGFHSFYFYLHGSCDDDVLSVLENISEKKEFACLHNSD